jgi:FAD/FMN-containing dehydrogenase
VWDGEVFNLAHLFVGSQGTLGILNRATVRLTHELPHKKMFVVFFKDWNEMPEFVNRVLPFDPESLEAFDEATLKLGIRFMPEIARKVGVSFMKFAFRFFPEVLLGMKLHGLPKLIILIELAERDEGVLTEKCRTIEAMLHDAGYVHRVLSNKGEEDKYWTMRRESFNLLRQHVKGKRTAPFIEDFCVDPSRVPEFLPRVQKLLRDNDIAINIAGHAGNGNFHIIPLMDLRVESEREKILRVADEFYTLVHEYGGSISAEHNDGILRTPYLHEMFTPRMLELFQEVKDIFDPQNIFNPGKKVGGSREYLRRHIATS